MRELFPLPRSLTGDGVRETLAVLGRDVPLEIVETPTGTTVFDWTVPREWTIREAWIEGPDGERVVDFADSSLHVLGYSRPVDATMYLDELREHVFTHPDDPDLVPYRTSYWEERWGFCMSRRQLDSLPDGRVSRRGRLDARGRLAHLRRGAYPAAPRRRSSCSAPTSVTRRSPTTTSRGSSCSGRSRGRSPDRSLATPIACSGARGRSGRSAGSPQPRDARPRAPRARDLVRRRPRAAQVQAKPPRQRDDRPSRGARARGEPASIVTGLGAARRRRAPVLLTRLRPAGRDLLAHAARALSRVSLVGGQPRSRHAGALAASFRAAPRDHRRRRDERAYRNPSPLRRASTREARPLPERPRRDEPGGRAPLGAQPRRRRGTTCSRSRSGRAFRTG